MSKRILALVPLLALASIVIAHGPTIGVTGTEIVHSDAGEFLQMQIDPPTGGTRLIAVSTPFGSAKLESRTGSSYQVVESIEVNHGQSLSGIASRYRVRLPAIPAEKQTVPVTLLFEGGTIVQSGAAIESGIEPASHRLRWLAGGAVAGLLAVVTACLAGTSRRCPSRGRP